MLLLSETETKTRASNESYVVTFHSEMYDAGNFGGSVSETPVSSPLPRTGRGSFFANGDKGYVTKWPAFYAGCGRITPTATAVVDFPSGGINGSTDLQAGIRMKD